jgi:hypothetical protein
MSFWIVTDYFWQAHSWTDNLLYRRHLKSAWISFPYFTASIILSCFNKTTGKIHGMASDHAVSVPKLERLFHSVLESGGAVISIVANSDNQMDPPFPLSILLQVMCSIRNMQLQYVRSHFCALLINHHLILQIIEKFQLYNLDYLDPRNGRKAPNAYIQQLWDSPEWRQITRRLLWTLMLDDNAYQASVGGIPRIVASKVLLLKPPIPDEQFVLGYDADSPHRFIPADLNRKWDDWYPLNDDCVQNLSWIVLDKTNPLRISGLKAVAGGVRHNGVALFTCLTHLVLASVEETCYQTEVCDSIKPLWFWVEFIDDIFCNLPQPLGKQMDSETARQWWGEQLALRFMLQLTRLIDARIRCQAWTPAMGVLDSVRDLNDACAQVAWSYCQISRLDGPRTPGPYVKFQPESKLEDWFKLLEGSNLEDVLTDAINLSHTLQQVSRLCRTYNVRMGSANIYIALRTVLIHLSVMARLSSQAHLRELLVSSLNDAMGHVEAINLMMHMTAAGTFVSQQAPWFKMLSDRITFGFETVTMDWVMKFYETTVVDIFTSLSSATSAAPEQK